MRIDNLSLARFRYMLMATVVTLVVMMGGKAASAQRIETYGGLAQLFYVYEIWVPGELVPEGKIVLRYNHDSGEAVFKDMKVEETRFDDDGGYYTARISEEVSDKIVGAGSRVELPFLKEEYAALTQPRIFTVMATGTGYVVNFKSCYGDLVTNKSSEVRAEGFVCRYVPKGKGEYKAISMGEYKREDFADTVREYKTIEESHSTDEKDNDDFSGEDGYVDGGDEGMDNSDEEDKVNDGNTTIGVVADKKTVTDAGVDENAATDMTANENAVASMAIMAGVISKVDGEDKSGGGGMQGVVKNNENVEDGEDVLLNNEKRIAQNIETSVVGKTKTEESGKSFRLRYGSIIVAVMAGVALWMFFVKKMNHRGKLEGVKA